MKTLKLNTVMSMLIAAIILTSCSKSDDLDQSYFNDDSKNLSENLSGQELEGLVFLTEKQKLHRDFYLTTFDNTKNKLFEQLYLSDQQSMDLISAVLAKYGEEKSILNLGVGDFILADIQHEYDESIQSNAKGLDQILATAIQMEKNMSNDIQMYMDQVVGNDDIILLYNDLLTELYRQLEILEAKI